MSKVGGARPGAGRPKGSRDKATGEQRAALSELARKYTTAALRTLVKVAKTGESEAARVAAANSILDRAYGKPTQAFQHSGPNGGPIEYRDMSDDEIKARIAAKLAELGKPDDDGLSVH